MRGGRYIIIFLLGVWALIPSAEWKQPPAVPSVPTHVPRSPQVARCQRLAATWTPADSDRSLARWTRCMRLSR